MRRLGIGLAVLLTLVGAALIWLQVPYANGPEQWRWEYRPGGLALGWAALSVVLAALIAWLGVRGTLASRAGALAGAALGAALSGAILLAQPGGFDRVAASLISKQTFGYLYDAALAAPTPELLSDYPARIRGLSMHSRTHPPGPILALRAIDSLLNRLSLPTPAAGSTGIAARAQAAMDGEVRRARDHGRPVPAVLPSPWTLVALAGLLPLLGALIAWPLFELGSRWGLDRERLSFALALWLLVPARTVFTPSLDQVLPLLLIAAAAAARGRWAAVAIAGFLSGSAALLSYGYLPWLGVVGGLAWLGPEPATQWPALAQRWRWTRLAWFGVAAALPWLALAPWGFDPLASVRAALGEHHAMAVVTRGYGLWLLWNPYDFALLLGPGVALLAAVAAVARWRDRDARWTWPALLIGGCFLVLWLGGSVRGEVGRIWLFFMPFACLAASAVADSRRARAAVLAAQGVLLLALAASLIFVS